MNKVEKIYKENINYVVPLIIFVAILAKIVEHFFLPGKYFYDNSRILNTVNDPNFSGRWPGSYEIASNFFRSINIFHLTTFLQWSILLGVFFNILLVILFSRSKGLDVQQTIFALMCVGILNIYIFNIGKDAIQILFFIGLFIIINLNINKMLKIIGCLSVLYWESTFYRNYYIIIAFFFLTIVLGISLFKKKRKRMNTIKIFIAILVLYFLTYAFLFVAKNYMPEDYHLVIGSKTDIEIMQSNSIIDDKIEHGGELNLFMLNYIINSIRMAFPIELLKAGVMYLPFVVFEIFLLRYLIKAILRLYEMDFKQTLALSIFLAYFMTSVLFEPDFGSFVRHEITTFPILYILIFNPDNWRIRQHSD